MTDNPNQQLIVLGFDDQASAAEMLTAANRMSEQGTLLLQDAVFVTKNLKGKVKVVETVDPSPGGAALGGAFWGFLFGALLFIPVAGMVIGAATSALMAKLIDTGVSDDFVKKLRESIEPGKVYLALLVSHVNEEKTLEELKRYAGMAELVYANVPDNVIAEVKDALGQEDVEHVADED